MALDSRLGLVDGAMLDQNKTDNIPKYKVVHHVSFTVQLVGSKEKREGKEYNLPNEVYSRYSVTKKKSEQTA